MLATRLGARSVRWFSHSARALAQQAGAAASEELRFTLSLPHAPLLDAVEVKRVTLPGREGAFGLEKSSPPLLAELRPGLIHVLHMDDKVDEYFIPGGFAFMNPDNTCSVTTPEGVTLDEVDADRLREGISAATAKRDAASPGSVEHSEALIALELYTALAKSKGVSG